VWGKVAVPGIVVAVDGVVVNVEFCGWPVWGKVAVPGIVVSAGGGIGCVSGIVVAGLCGVKWL
jgi:hypothetical protein